MIHIARTRDNGQMRKMLFDQLNHLHTGLWIVDGVNQYLGLRRAGGFQQINPGRITVKYFHIEFTQRIHMVRIVIEDNHFDSAGEQ